MFSCYSATKFTTNSLSSGYSSPNLFKILSINFKLPCSSKPDAPTCLVVLLLVSNCYSLPTLYTPCCLQPSILHVTSLLTYSYLQFIFPENNFSSRKRNHITLKARFIFKKTVFHLNLSWLRAV